MLFIDMLRTDVPAQIADAARLVWRMKKRVIKLLIARQTSTIDYDDKDGWLVLIIQRAFLMNPRRICISTMGRIIWISRPYMYTHIPISSYLQLNIPFPPPLCRSIFTNRKLNIGEGGNTRKRDNYWTGISWKKAFKATKQQQHSGPIEMAFILLLTTSHKTFSEEKKKKR